MQMLTTNVKPTAHVCRGKGKIEDKKEKSTTSSFNHMMNEGL